MEDKHVLIVDDDEPLRRMLETSFRKEGFLRVDAAGDGASALAKCRALAPDLVVLDVMLPDRDGFSICQEIRTFSAVPVLFLTARSSDLDKLKAFGLGTDDYVTKPFNPLEVVARARAHLRRQDASAITEGRTFRLGRFEVRHQSGELLVDGQPVACPAKEFRLLSFLCAHPNQVFSRSHLYEAVWGEASLGDDNTVMVHIRRLRERVEEDPANPKFLVTVRGLGYKLARPSSAGVQAGTCGRGSRRPSSSISWSWASSSLPRVLRSSP